MEKSDTKKFDSQKFANLLAFLAIIITLSSFRDDFKAIPVKVFINTDLFMLFATFGGMILAATYLYTLADSIANVLVNYKKTNAAVTNTAYFLHAVAMIFPLFIIVVVVINLVIDYVIPSVNFELVDTFNTIIAGLSAVVALSLSASLGIRSQKNQTQYKIKRLTKISLIGMGKAEKALKDEKYSEFINCINTSYYSAAHAVLLSRGYKFKYIDEKTLEELLIKEKILTKADLKAFNSMKNNYRSEEQITTQQLSQFTKLSRKLFSSLYKFL